MSDLMSKADAANRERRENCPNREAHVVGAPEDGYAAWIGWARRMSKTHKQRRCHGCDLWLIWEPRSGVSE